MDYIELALDYYTDFVKFERLSIEIMALEGFPHIKKIGGIHDDGIDAEVVYYMDEEIKTLVFQFSIQRNVQGKVIKTIQDLRDNGIVFNELFLVTKHSVNNIQEIRNKVRTEFSKSINLEVFEKTTFIKHLSLRRDILARYFPDIRTQLVQDLLEKATIFSETSEEKMTTSFLKCSLLFTFNRDAAPHRKSIFDNTVLAIIVNLKKCSIEEIAKEFGIRFHKNLQQEQIFASVERIHKLKFVHVEEDKYVPTGAAAERIQGHVELVNAQTVELINDIVNRVNIRYGKKVDSKLEKVVALNIKRALSLFFRLYGLDYNYMGNMGFPAFKIESETDIIRVAKESIPPDLGDVLVYCLGETLKLPTAQQASVLANWAKAFIGVQIMSLDPLLKEFQIGNIKNKVFLLDTDFVLFCITDYCPQSSVYQKLLYSISKLGCQIIIPQEVIEEVCKHAEFSFGNYNYFKNTFNNVDELIVAEKVQNIFVKDYYFSIIKFGKKYKNFKEYLDNFYEPSSRLEFLTRVIKQKIKIKFEIHELCDVVQRPIDQETLVKLTNLIYDETVKTFKSSYRTEEENKIIAATDATMYLSVKTLNENAPHEKSGILIATHYLITSSTRAVRCAKKIGINDELLIKPQTLISLFDDIGIFETTATDVVNLFENPFLVDVVELNWEYIKPLVDAGVDLQNIDVTRLSWNLEKTIHKYLVEELENAEEVNEKPLREEKHLTVDEFIEFATEIKSVGLKFIPNVEVLLSKYEEMKQRNETLEEIKETLNDEIQKYGRRKQHYINKISKKKGK
ncbi:MAG: hypothetical protein NTW16_18875 [Bacteroidetes bacterium]|nr:hypothetical protein [Bacteroidota bacterium]